MTHEKTNKYLLSWEFLVLHSRFLLHFVAKKTEKTLVQTLWKYYKMITNCSQLFFVLQTCTAKHKSSCINNKYDFFGERYTD